MFYLFKNTFRKVQIKFSILLSLVSCTWLKQSDFLRLREGSAAHSGCGRSCLSLGPSDPVHWCQRAPWQTRMLGAVPGKQSQKNCGADL